MRDGSSTESALHCARCHYDLRMIDPAGLCPECGLPIEQSIAIARDPLRKARRQIHRAAIVLLAAMAIRLSFFLTVIVWQYQRSIPVRAWTGMLELSGPWPLEELGGEIRRIGSQKNWAILLLILFWAISFAAHCAGIWMITICHSGMKRDFIRLAARWSAVGAIAWFTVLLYAPSFLGPPPLTSAVTLAEVAPPLLLIVWSARLLVALNRRAWTWAVALIAAVGTLAYAMFQMRWPRWIYYTTPLSRLSIPMAFGLGAIVGSVAMAWLWLMLLTPARQHQNADS